MTTSRASWRRENLFYSVAQNRGYFVWVAYSKLCRIEKLGEQVEFSLYTSTIFYEIRMSLVWVFLSFCTEEKIIMTQHGSSNPCWTSEETLDKTAFPSIRIIYWKNRNSFCYSGLQKDNQFLTPSPLLWSRITDNRMGSYKILLIN